MEIAMDRIHGLWRTYEYYLSRSDKRVDNWLLMGSYYPTLCLTAVYLVIVWYGPRLMENRKPMRLDRILFLYNLALVALNFHIFYELLTASWRLNYSYICQPVAYTDDPDEMRIARALWWYYFSKLIEFIDTFFFIIRKKNKQISFLHVYHHATMFPIWWTGIKWAAGGQSFFGAMINSFIHVLMYTYYGASALGPQFQKYLWWKKYLTSLQLVQFLICLLHVFQSMYFDCDFPKWMLYGSVLYGVTILCLFFNFYYESYIRHESYRSKVQFVLVVTHAVYSVVTSCPYPQWMQWSLIAYGVSILLLFLNFYFQSYIKPRTRTVAQTNGQASTGNGHTKYDLATNGFVHKNKGD